MKTVRLVLFRLILIGMGVLVLVAAVGLFLNVIGGAK